MQRFALLLFALANSGQLQIELTQPRNAAPSMWHNR